jgi:hypothetical protein
MKRLFSSSFKSLRAFGHLAVCVVGLAMLLLFPAAKVHTFGAHFRNPEVRRSAQRHIFIAQSENTDGRIAESAPLPVFFAPTENVQHRFALDNQEFTTEVSFAHLVNRMKLNPPGSNAQDPLLQA